MRTAMDGRGRWMGNVFVERPWRRLDDGCVSPYAFESGSELRAGLTAWTGCYDTRRPRSAVAGRAPDEAHAAAGMDEPAASRQPEPGL